MKFSIHNFFSQCDQIRRKLRIWSHLLKKSLMENFIFCTVTMEWRKRFFGRNSAEKQHIAYSIYSNYRSIVVKDQVVG